MRQIQRLYGVEHRLPLFELLTAIVVCLPLLLMRMGVECDLDEQPGRAAGCVSAVTKSILLFDDYRALAITAVVWVGLVISTDVIHCWCLWSEA